MLSFTRLVFDEIIAGTATTWFTSAGFNDLLGSADRVSLHLITTDVSGTSPTLECSLQESGNAMDWVDLSPSLQGSIVTDGSKILRAGSAESSAFGRIKVFLGGTSPRCRLKVYAVGFNLAARTTAPALKPRGGCGC
jgi:hypothetical protein